MKKRELLWRRFIFAWNALVASRKHTFASINGRRQIDTKEKGPNARKALEPNLVSPV